MKIEKLIACSVVVAFVGLVLHAGAQVPAQLQYQGRLADSVTGAALNETVAAEFAIFDVSTGGAALWEDTFLNVVVEDGYFTVPLGSTENPLSALPFDKPYFLEVTVNGETLSPRLPFSPAPYAFRSASVDDNAIDAAALDATVVDPLGGLGQAGDGALKIATEGVTSSMIRDGEITEADIDAESKIVLTDAYQPLTNKTFDAMLNTLTGVNVADFATGEVASDLDSLDAANPDQLATALAVKSYVDGVPAAGLGDLTDTQIETPLSADMLVRDAASGTWVNEALTGAVALDFASGVLTSSITSGAVSFDTLAGDMIAADANAIDSGSSSQLTTAAAVLEFMDLESGESAWQQTVLDLWDPTGGLPSPVNDADRYIAAVSANDWSQGWIYEYYTDMAEGAQWVGSPPVLGMTCWVQNMHTHYTYANGEWAPTDPYDNVGGNVTFSGSLAVKGDVFLGDETTDAISILGKATFGSGVQFSGLTGPVAPGMVLAATDSLGSLDWLTLGPQHIANAGGVDLTEANSSTDSGAAIVGAYSGMLDNAAGSSVQQILEDFDDQITAASELQNAIISVETPDSFVMTADTPSGKLDFVEGLGIEITGVGPERGSSSIAVTVGLASDSITLNTEAGLTGGTTVSLGNGLTIGLDPALAGEGLGFNNGILGINSGDGLEIVGDILGIKKDSSVFALGLNQELTLAHDINGVDLHLDADMVDGRNVDDGELTDQYLWTAQQIQSHVQEKIEAYGPSTDELNWRRSVIQFWDPTDNDQGFPTGIPDGYRYIAVAEWTEGETTWYANSIYEWNNGDWHERFPGFGDTVFVEYDGAFVTYAGGGWQPMSAGFRHDDLADIAGGGINTATQEYEYYHLSPDQADLLADLPTVPLGNLLAVVDSGGGGKIGQADLAGWVQAGTNIDVAPGLNGSVTISVNGIINNAENMLEFPDNLASADAIVGHIDNRLQSLALVDLADVQLGALVGGEYLKFDSSSSKWQDLPEIPGADVQRAPLGGIVDDGGLKVALDGSSLKITETGLKVNLASFGSIGVVYENDEEGLDVLDYSIDELHLSGMDNSEPGLQGQVLGSNGEGGFTWVDGTPFSRMDYETWEHGMTGSLSDVAMAGADTDSAGNTYVADAGNNRVLKFDTQLQIVGYIDGDNTGWASGAPPPTVVTGTGDGYFGGPTDVAVDETSSPAVLYVADADNGRVVKMNLETGIFIATDIGEMYNVPNLPNGFRPQGLGVGENGRLFVADSNNSIVQVFDSAGNLVGWYGKGVAFSGWHSSGDAVSDTPAGSEGGEFTEPVDVAAGSEYGIYVADKSLDRIQRLLRPADATANGSGGDCVSQWGFQDPGSIAIQKGTIAVSSLTHHIVNLYDSDGAFEETIGIWDSPGNADRQFNTPWGVAPIFEGLVVVDAGNSRLQTFYPLLEGPPSTYTMATDGSNVAIGASYASESAVLQIDSTTGGLLIPRMGDYEVMAIENPENGLLVYQTYPDSGFRYYDMTTQTWKTLVSSDDGSVAVENIAVAGSATLGDDESTDGVEINGALKVTSGNPGEGKVLTSDDSGNASWKKIGTANVIRVSSGESIQAAIDAYITANPYYDSLLVRVGPGVFSEKISLPSDVSIEGAGVVSTFIESDGGLGETDQTTYELRPVQTDATVSIVEGDNCEIRNLTIRSERYESGVALGFFSQYIYSESVRLTNVRIEAGAGSSAGVCAGMYVDGGDGGGPCLHNVSVSVSGYVSEKTVGIWGYDASGYGEWDVDQVEVEAGGSSSGTVAGLVCEGLALSVTNSRISIDEYTSASNVYGVWAKDSSSTLVYPTAFRNTVVEVEGYASSAVGLKQEIGETMISHCEISTRNSGYALELSPYAISKVYYTTVAGYAGPAQSDASATLKWRRCWDETNDAELHTDTGASR